jgi:hypothetical protein
MADATSKKSRFFVGLPNGERKGELTTDIFAIKSQEKYDGSRDYGEEIIAGKFSFIEVESNERFLIGERLAFETTLLNICAIKCVCRGGMVQFSYCLSGKHHYYQEEYYNNRLQGRSLTGTVLQTRGETVKLHLDIDPEQKEATAFAYDWKPRVGNLFYCMPEVGTRVGLYLPVADERRAMAVYPLRENGDVCPEITQAPENLAVANERKYFTTIHGKQLYHDPLELSLKLLGADETRVNMLDGKGITSSTKAAISIRAKRTVKLGGKAVMLRADQEATMIRKDLSSPTVMNICNAFDTIGGSSGFNKNSAPSVASSSHNGMTRDAALPVGAAEIYSQMLGDIPIQEVSDETGYILAGSIPIGNRHK